LKIGKFNISLTDALQFVSILAAIALGVVGFVRDCAQDRKLEEINFESSSLQHRPYLKVVGNPEIREYKIIGSKKFAIKDLQPQLDSSTPRLEIPSDLTVRVRLRLANVGNAPARIYLIVWGDTTTGEDQFRKTLTTFEEVTPDTSYFKTKEIPQGDSTFFEEERQIGFFSNNTFTLHLIFVYANDSHGIFDTYFWARFEAKPIETLYRRQIIHGHSEYVKIEEHPSASEVVKVIATNQSSKVYSKDEAQLLVDHLEHMSHLAKRK